MPRKPSPLTVDPIHARVIRGPRADGRLYWQARRHTDGRSEAVWSGWASRDEARAALAAIVADGGLERPRSFNDLHTVRDLLESWIGTVTERADIAKGTRSNYTIKARHLATGLGDIRLDRLDLADLETYRDRRLRAKGAAASVALELNILQIAWKWGRAVGACSARDLPRLRVKGEAKRNHRTPEPGEVAAVVGLLDGWRRVAVLLLYGTGARLGEVASLTWSAVDLDGEAITVHGKTGERTVPLNAHLVAELRRLPRKGSQVLGVSPASVAASVQTAIARACEEAGVPAFTPHGLRRAAVDSLLRAGVDPGTACAILGHSPAVMLQHYRRSTMDDRRKAVAAARLGMLPAGEVIAFGKKAIT